MCAMAWSTTGIANVTSSSFMSVYFTCFYFCSVVYGMYVSIFLFLGLCYLCMFPTALGVSDEQCHGSLTKVVSGQLLYGDQHPRVDVLGVNAAYTASTFIVVWWLRVFFVHLLQKSPNFVQIVYCTY